MKQFLSFSLIVLFSFLLVGLVFGVGSAIQSHPEQEAFTVTSNSVSLPLTSPPTTTISLKPSIAYLDSILYGSGEYSDPDGDPEENSTYRWLLNSIPYETGEVPQSLLLPFDNDLSSTDGQLPTTSQTLSFVQGKHGQAVQISRDNDSILTYPTAGNVDPNEGSIEMWLMLAYDLDNPVYDDYPRIFSYVIDSEHQLYAEVNLDRIILTSLNEGAYYGSWANPPGWQAGEWHHFAASWSSSSNQITIYYDCAKAGEGEFPALSGSSATFDLGGESGWGQLDAAIDDVRISRRPLSLVEIASSCERGKAAPNDEVIFEPGQLTIGDSLTFELTPCDNTLLCGNPVSATVTIERPPLGALSPYPTLFAPGTLTTTFSLTTTQPCDCRWSETDNTPYTEMEGEFQLGQGTTTHSTIVDGFYDLADRWFFVRCMAVPTPGADQLNDRDPDDYQRSTHLRVLNQVNPAYPRKGNLWGWWELIDSGLPHLARQDLILGADGLTSDQIIELRNLNPNIRILTSINAVENFSLPDDYYLKDVNGNRIEVWPGSYRLNLTKDYVAEYQAYYAYQTLLDTDLQADGVFFDNVFTTQSWLEQDIYGNTVEIDADEDGVADDPDDLDSAWKAGVFHEIETFRQLMPHAIISGHAMNIYEPGIAENFNGISIGFWIADVLQGEQTFADVWKRYTDWINLAKTPQVTMFESSPLDEIAYGYDYSPWDGKIPTSTLEFAQNYTPWMRFGLALTLMSDGYFAHEYGDTWHGNDWWYDELEADLGYPLGPARLVDLGTPPAVDLIDNGDFEDPPSYPWTFWANTSEGCTAEIHHDTTTSASGSASVRVEITTTSGTDWHIALAQVDRPLEANASYDLSFWSKSNASRMITLGAQKDSPEWDYYGLWQHVGLSTNWQPYTVTFQSTATTTDAAIQFMLGETSGKVWIDRVQLKEHPPDVLRRDFSNGTVLLNATQQEQTIQLEPGYRRLTGNQAPRYETILEDTNSLFSTIGNWETCQYDSGQWQASGPFYHDWGEGCHQGLNGTARWELPITASDTYTITAWWPAAPEANGWNSSVTFQVIEDGTVVAETIFNQQTGGDQWHLVGSIPLDPADAAYVQMICSGSDPCIADALHLRSRARYNDGSLAPTIILSPMDGILLLRQGVYRCLLPLVMK